MNIKTEKILTLLKNAFPNSKINLDDYKGDQNHYYLIVESKLFFNKTKIQQHQMVYNVSKNMIGHELLLYQLKLK